MRLAVACGSAGRGTAAACSAPRGVCAQPRAGLSRPRTAACQVKSTDLRTKALALEKMAYLHMLGYDMSSAAFHVVEARASAAQRSP